MMFAAVALLWLPAAVYCWNAAAPLPLRWHSKYLNGPPMEATPISATRLDTVIDRTFQDSLAKAIGPSVPFLNDVIRLHNQVLYGGFGISPSKHILIGKDEYLHNPIYMNAYCRRDLTASSDILRQWAQQIRSMQDIATARGQIFLYVLTPSKIEHIPETMPVAFPCRSQDREVYVAAALSYLDAAGVTYVNASASIDAIEKKYGYDPFPKFGIHWTQLAAYPATLEIIRAINEAKGKLAIIPYEIAVTPAEKPLPYDYDYGHLLNVVWTPTPNDTAAFSVVTPSPSQCPPPLSILAIGGSFFQALGANLSRGPCPPKMAHLFYLSFDTYFYEGGRLRGTGKADYELLKPADVVIIEENIGVMPAVYLAKYQDYVRTGQPPRERVDPAGD